jgi:hypothetical protein
MRRWLAFVVAIACSAALVGPAVAGAPSLSGTGIGPEVTLTGTLRLLHVDDFVAGVGRDAYALDTASGLVALDIAGPAPVALNGARVRVHGTSSSAGLRVDLRRDTTGLIRLGSAPSRASLAVSQRGGASIVLRGPTAAAAATRRIAVLLFDFSDDPSQPYTPATADTIVASSGSAVVNYYAEEARGAVTLTGQVFGWYQIAASKAVCDPFTWATQAEAAASAAGVDLSGYTNVVYAFPHASSCGWAGLGEMPGSHSWNNGAMGLRVVAHELGHNFGVHHASSLSCTSGAVRVSISTTCSSSEYGDPFSVMGSGASTHNNAVHLGQFGWLAASEIQNAVPGGPYQLGSILDGPPSSARLLRIARGNGTWLYLDLRSVHPPYFDDFDPSDPAVNGVTVRISPDAPSPSWGLSQTQLVDTTPGTATYADAPLAVGATLTDPVSGLEITTISAGSGVASVGVVDPIAPGTAGTFKATATGASTVALTWTAAPDNFGIAHYRVLRDGVDVGSPSGLTFNDSGRSPKTTYAYRLIPVDYSGNEGPQAAASATTPPAGTDVLAPTAPTSVKSSRVSSTVTKLYWSGARDDFGVTGYKVYQVGVTKAIKTVSLRWVNLKRIAGARYYVRAFDAAGHLSPKSPTRRT